MEFTLLFAAAIGVAAGAAGLRWEAARGNAADCAADLWEIFLGAAVVGLVVGRLAAMIGTGVNPITNPSDLVIVRGGVATGPAAVAALATVAYMGRPHMLQVADALAVAALVGLAGWHLGCLPRGACVGAPSDLPWAMSQPGSSIGRHPVELYAAGLLALAGIALAWRRKRPLAPGASAAVALLVAAAVRLVTEPLRLSLGGGPVWWYVAGIAAAAAGLVAIRRRRTT